MLEYISGFHPVAQALLAGIFTWSITAVGAAFVYAHKTANQKVLDAMLGFAGGVMIAASFWSLLAPAIEMAQTDGVPAWIPAASGFLLGTIFLRLLDKILPHLPAIALAIGIGIQNFPERFAVSVPLRRDGMAPGKCFWYGQLSAVVEPVAAVIGAATVVLMKPLLPYALSFAAGAMIFVVVEEVIPESQRHGHTDLATAGTIAGFIIMMVLDVALSG